MRKWANLLKAAESKSTYVLVNIQKSHASFIVSNED